METKRMVWLDKDLVVQLHHIPVDKFEEYKAVLAEAGYKNLTDTFDAIYAVIGGEE